MMRALFIASALAIVAAGPVLGQQLGERIPGQRPDAGMPRGAAPPGAMRPCPQYGPGFVRLNGSATCVRLGGEVRFEYGAGGGRGRQGAGSGVRSGVGVELDARTETDVGTLRAVVRGNAASSSGVMQGQRW